MGKSREELDAEAQQYADEYSNRNVDLSKRKDIGDYVGDVLKMVYGMTPLPEYVEWFNNPDYSTYQALYDLQDKYVPFNSAYQNWRLGNNQEWDRNAVDALAMALPVVKLGKAGIGAAEKGMAKANAAYERATGKSAKGGFVNFTTETGKKAQAKPLNEFGRNPQYIKQMLDDPEVFKKPANWLDLPLEERAKLYTEELQTNPKSTFTQDFQTHPILFSADDATLINGYLLKHPEKAAEWNHPRAENIKLIATDPAYKTRRQSSFKAAAAAEARERDYLGLDKDVPKFFTDEDIWGKKKEAPKPKVVDQAKLDAKAAKQAEKEARWKAEREAQAKAAEENRLAKEAKEAEERRLAEEEAARIQAEADAKAAEEAAFEEEYQRMLAEEEASKLADEEAAKRAQEEFDYLYNQELANENANHIASIDEFADVSTGIETPVITEVQNPTGTRATYNHSRPFNGGTFAVLDPIDRQTLRKNEFNLGDRIFDAHSKFLAGTANPGEKVIHTSTGRPIREELPKNLIQDPYYQAGVINDANIKLNAKIDALRAEGLTDAQIYEELKPDLEKYQGMVERYKYRLNNPEAKFDYDGASTSNIVATPSEEINVLRALGLTPDNPRAADIMDKYNNFYGQLINRINQYYTKQKVK